ncbi:hypothetical protein HN011_002724 [Eciton burchellii]|nr:hypothetical protein HN011_002724 [Eciton burchellii]
MLRSHTSNKKNERFVGASVSDWDATPRVWGSRASREAYHTALRCETSLERRSNDRRGEDAKALRRQEGKGNKGKSRYEVEINKKGKIRDRDLACTPRLHGSGSSGRSLTLPIRARSTLADDDEDAHRRSARARLAAYVAGKSTGRLSIFRQVSDEESPAKRREKRARVIECTSGPEVVIRCC